MENRSPFYNRIKKNQKQLKSYLAQQAISCYRIYDWDMPEYPLCVDVYEQQIHIAEYRTRHPLDEEEYQDWLKNCMTDIKDIFALDDSQLFLKVRERQKGESQYQKVNTVKQFTEVKENGIRFLVNLHDYLDTGLFLDHRPTRKMVMDNCKGKLVLNLFAYTGSFSVYAAMGGALSTTTVDLSNTYLNWAKENFKLNNLPIARHQFIKTDVKEWIKQTPPKLYDIIVLDPPTHSRSSMSKTTFEIQLDHVELLTNTLKHLKPEGTLYFSTNFSEFKLDTKAFSSFSIEDISLQTIPNDFRNKKIHYCWKIRKSSPATIA